MEKEELRDRYEASGDERLYQQAMALYEQALQHSPGDARLLLDYGYLQECHGRNAIRAAAECYRQAIDADPGWDKPHYQLLGALESLRNLRAMLPQYERRAADSPDDPRGHRLLAAACLAAGDYDKAAAAIGAGLQIAPDDPALTEARGDLHAATGQPDDALANWHRAFTLAPEGYGISMRYSAAFLLERQGRLAEAAEEWRFIINWLDEHGYAIQADWPRRELERLEAQLAGR